MSRQVKVSYCVLTRNSGKTLRATLESIKQQTIPKEIIIIDTESNDDTLEIAKDFTVKFIEERTGNLARARNIGLDASNGQYLAFVDSDCILFPGWDKRMIAYLREDNVAGAGCNWLSVGDSPVEQSQDAVVSRHRGIIDTSSIATMNAMYRRDRIGSTTFDEQFSGASEDVDFNFSLRAKGYKLLFDAGKFVRHHNPTTVSDLGDKYFKYGLWYIKPYRKHPQEQNRSYHLRRLFLAMFVFNFVASFIFPPWMFIFYGQVFAPFLAYFRITNNLTFAFHHWAKFFAHMIGMGRSLIR